MGLSAMQWAWNQHDVTPTEKLTLLALADQADGSFDCAWLGFKTFTARTGLPRRSVFRALASLGAKKLLEMRKDERGKFLHLCAPALPPPPEDEWVTVTQNAVGQNGTTDLGQNGTQECQNGTQECQNGPIAPPPQLSLLVTGSSPDLRSRSKNKKKNKRSSAATEFPPEDSWLKEFLESGQHTFNGAHLPRLLDPDWWEALSIETNGINRPFLETAFASMKRWLLENPSRMPTPVGVRRFVGGWLKRNAERERRFPNGNQSARRG